MSLELLSHMIVGIVSGTPLWVFALLAYLIRQGIRRLDPQVSTIRRVAVAPLVFVAWGLYGLATRADATGLGLGLWLATAVGGIGLSLLSRPRGLQVDRWRGLVRQPGSMLPLVRYLLVFGSHYALNIAMAIRPGDRATLALCDIAVSGVSAGYFVGWIVAFFAACRQASDTDLSGGGPSRGDAAVEAA
jgi:hypothetical protein